MSLKRKLSMPYWCVANPVGDPFGPGVMERISSLEVTDILCDTKKDGLIEFTSAHDDDLVDWDPYHENDVREIPAARADGVTKVALAPGALITLTNVPLGSIKSN